MIRHVDNDLNALKSLLLSMGGQVEKALSLIALSSSRLYCDQSHHVRATEQRINDFHLRIDEACLLILATKAPVAVDLRTVLAVHKVNADLERMGDQIFSIAGSLTAYARETHCPLPPPWMEMLEDVTWMVKNTLDAFSSLDVSLSRQVLQHDDLVDCHNTDLTEIVKERMKKGSIEINAGAEALAMIRSLERVADHATNVAEEVIFIVTGDDIRHGRIHSV